jgi:hypothetical protein
MGRASEEGEPMKYWRWKCQPCGREITILAGTVPKPCHLCSGSDFLKLGETNNKNESAEDFRKRTRKVGYAAAMPAPGQVRLIFDDDTTFGDVVNAIVEAAGWQITYASNDGPEFTPAKDVGETNKKTASLVDGDVIDVWVLPAVPLGPIVFVMPAKHDLDKS